MEIKFKIISNRRDMKSDHETSLICSVCGNRTSVFVRLIPDIYLCKSCLLNGVDLIDKELLTQAKTRVK